jgi:7-cyano-7-deazaguanine synthase
MRAIVLLSGGLDSYTAAAIAKVEGFTLCALTVQYGQRHVREVEAARTIARALGVERHLELPVDLRAIGGSALTSDTAVPRDRDVRSTEIPQTYVPARNTIFLALALGWAEVLDARDIFIGVNALDYSGYPDCRPEFIRAFESLAALGTRAGVEGARFRVHTPLIALSKAGIISRGLDLGLD